MSSQNISSKVKHLHLISNKLVDSIFAGNYHSVFKGPGLEFDDVREYVSGDDPRFIDWNVSSRMGSPYTKRFKEEREIVLQVLVDTSSSLYFSSGKVNKREQAGHLFALLGLAAVANNDKVGCLFFNDKIEEHIPPRKGRKHVLKQISQILSLEESGGKSDLALALTTASQSMKRKGICVILSDFRTSHYKKELLLLARRHDVIAIRLTDPLDRDFPSAGLLSLEDPESHMAWSGLGSKKMRRDYHNFWLEERQAWFNLCKSCGVDTLEISTEDDPAIKLLNFFERRKKR